MEQQNKIWHEGMVRSRRDGRVTVTEIRVALGIADEGAVERVLETMCDYGWLVKDGGEYKPAIPPTGKLIAQG